MKNTLIFSLLFILAVSVSFNFSAGAYAARGPMSNTLSQWSEFDTDGQFIETADVSGYVSNKAVLQAAKDQTNGNGHAIIIGDGGAVGVNGVGSPVVLPADIGVVANGYTILRGW